MNPIDAITPRKYSLTLACGRFEMSEMSIRRAVELMKIVSALSSEVKKSLLEGTDNVTAIAIIAGIAEPRLPEAAALLIDGSDETRDLCGTLTARDLSEVAAAAAELNDFPAIIANFRRAAQTARTRSAPPSC